MEAGASRISLFGTKRGGNTPYLQYLLGEATPTSYASGVLELF